MVDELRRIEPLPRWRELPPGPPDLGPRPEVLWVAPTDLYVDEDYQRELSERSYRLIKRGCENFAWSKMQWPKVARVGDKLHMVDGQHTAIMAATLGIPEIPVIVDVTNTKEERAGAFVAINQNRLRMTDLQVFRGLVASGDADALDMVNVCARAGVRLRQFNAKSRPRVGDSMSVGTIRRLVIQRGVRRAREILQSLVLGERAPISTAEIAAAELTMVRNAGLTPERLGAVVRALGDDGVREARMAAMATRSPVKYELNRRYLELLRRQAGIKEENVRARAHA